MTSPRFYLFIFLLFAVVYIGTLPLQPYPADFIVKAVPAISLSVLALTKVPGRQGKLLFTALLFCAAGDAALKFGEGNLTLGLGFFLVGQIIYAVTFYRNSRTQASRVPVVILLIAYAVAMALVLAPSLEDMALPVYVYITAITAMGICAALRARSKVVLYGAIFFIASDSILAANEFLYEVPTSDYLVMVTYYIAQVLIVLGFIREE